MSEKELPSEVVVIKGPGTDESSDRVMSTIRMIDDAEVPLVKELAEFINRNKDTDRTVLFHALGTALGMAARTIDCQCGNCMMATISFASMVALELTESSEAIPAKKDQN